MPSLANGAESWYIRDARKGTWAGSDTRVHQRRGRSPQRPFGDVGCQTLKAGRKALKKTPEQCARQHIKTAVNGLVVRPGSTCCWRGRPPPFYLMMRELSVFVDESGDFGQYDHHCPFYIVSMVFHEQANDLTERISDLERKLSEIGHAKTCVHCGPIIRAEEEYRGEDIQTRKKIIMRMMSFVRSIDIKYDTLCVEKKHIEDDVELVLRLSKQLSSIIKSHLDYFQSFDEIKVYYDNGQAQVRRLLTSVFGVLLENVRFKTVSPSDYRLFQVADLVCTLKLVSIKFERKISSKAEKGFFGGFKEFKENYSKSLKPKKLK